MSVMEKIMKNRILLLVIAGSNFSERYNDYIYFQFIKICVI